MAGFYDFKVKTRDEGELDLATLKGKTVLVVNTATGCGFTPQYEGLEDLYRKYHQDGLEILDFPCNQFGEQAPESDEEIHNFCVLKYETSFDQLKKVDVNGENAEPLFKWLKEQAAEDYIVGAKHKIAMAGIRKISKSCKEKGDIVWNFTKFLVSPEGKVVMRVSPIEKPEVMERRIGEMIKGSGH